MKRFIIIAAFVGLVAALVVWSKTRPVVIRTCNPTIGTVHEYVEEDGKTRLDDEYLITMPINGRVRRITLKEGDTVSSGEVVARVDDFPLQRQLEQARSKIEELESLIEGVDAAKPKPEEIEASRLRVHAAELKLEGAVRDRSVTEINYKEAERDFERMKKLLRTGVVQQAEYDETKRARDTLSESLAAARIAEQATSRSLEIAQLEYARILDSVDDNEYQRGVYQAQIKQAESEIELVCDDLEKTEIKSPVNGIVLEKYIEDEQVLTAGMQLLKIGDLDSIEIESDILSEEVGLIHPGDRVEIAGKAVRNEEIEGRVKRIYPSGFKKISALGIEQQRVKVIIDFDNSKLALRPYVSVDVRVIVDEHADVMTVPEQAAFKNSDEWSVFVIEDGRLRLRKVEVGLRNDVVMEIAKGLKMDDVVVSEPTNDLKPNLRAKPAE